VVKVVQECPGTDLAGQVVIQKPPLPAKTVNPPSKLCVCRASPRVDDCASPGRRRGRGGHLLIADETAPPTHWPEGGRLLLAHG
jgi:hypothetical protein